MTKKIGFILIIAAWASIVLFSCHKETLPKAVVTIIDTGGVRISNVRVRVKPPPNGSYIDPQTEVLEEIQYTDAGGDASFNFKNKAIFNVDAWIKINLGTTQAPIWKELQGKKLLILENDKTVYLTIIIK
jgi:hypothetical protein